MYYLLTCMNIVNKSIEKRLIMLDFEEELKKFQPSLEIDDVEDVINSNELTDLTDVVKDLLKDLKDKE